jgi:hypothetical protein
VFSLWQKIAKLFAPQSSFLQTEYSCLSEQRQHVPHFRTSNLLLNKLYIICTGEVNLDMRKCRYCLRIGDRGLQKVTEESGPIMGCKMRDSFLTDAQECAETRRPHTAIP